MATVATTSSSSKIMAAELGSSASASTATSDSAARSLSTKKKMLWPSLLRWIPTSTDHIIAAEKRLLTLVKTPHVHEQVNVGSGPPGSKVRWFRSASNEPRFVNTVTFEGKEDACNVMIHGYGASLGFFFRNFDALASLFKMIAIDQLGGLGPWGPNIVRRYTTNRFGAYAQGEVLTDEESKMLTEYVYHTLAAKASGELCLKYIFTFGVVAPSRERTGLESANYLHVWCARLDVLSRSRRNSQRNEGPLRDYQSSQGWPFCIHRQPKRIPFGRLLCLLEPPSRSTKNLFHKV